ncbi:PHP-associated domain-containing protein [Candidatus Formimonas warabiya]|nr:PHP domain-containing protein [Candidatus Formimonas warabiya]
MMIIDTHLHESKYSLDSSVSLEEIVSRAREMGLDGVCITDHESNEITDEAKRLSKETGFLILVGAEILTYEGDMTVFGLAGLPQEKMHACELIELVSQNKGVAISSHPYRQNNRGMGDHIRDLRNLWAVEAFNGSTEFSHNMRAYHLSRELNLPCLGGSDAHLRHKVGRFATVFPDGIRDERDFIEAVVAKEVFPVTFEGGRFISCIEDSCPGF